MGTQMEARKLKAVKYTVEVHVASYDDVPGEDGLVDAICEGISDHYPNASVQVLAKSEKEDIDGT